MGWECVSVARKGRADFPTGDRNNHYFAARMTSSTSLRVKTTSGDQQEKFLFYRGVSTFSVPLSATLDAAGKLRIKNHGDQQIPTTILFERRGEKVGYRIGSALKEEGVLDSPELTSFIGDLGRNLEGILVAQGPYHDKAPAIVQNVRHSRFEEGSRLLYIVPSAFVNA